MTTTTLQLGTQPGRARLAVRPVGGHELGSKRTWAATRVAPMPTATGAHLVNANTPGFDITCTARHLARRTT